MKKQKKGRWKKYLAGIVGGLGTIALTFQTKGQVNFADPSSIDPVSYGVHSFDPNAVHETPYIYRYLIPPKNPVTSKKGIAWKQGPLPSHPADPNDTYTGDLFYKDYATGKVVQFASNFVNHVALGNTNLAYSWKPNEDADSELHVIYLGFDGAPIIDFDDNTHFVDTGMGYYIPHFENMPPDSYMLKVPIEPGKDCVGTQISGNNILTLVGKYDPSTEHIPDEYNRFWNKLVRLSVLDLMPQQIDASLGNKANFANDEEFTVWTQSLPDDANYGWGAFIYDDITKNKFCIHKDQYPVPWDINVHKTPAQETLVTFDKNYSDPNTPPRMYIKRISRNLDQLEINPPTNPYNLPEYFTEGNAKGFEFSTLAGSQEKGIVLAYTVITEVPYGNKDVKARNLSDDWSIQFDLSSSPGNEDHPSLYIDSTEAYFSCLRDVYSDNLATALGLIDHPGATRQSLRTLISIPLSENPISMSSSNYDLNKDAIVNVHDYLFFKAHSGHLTDPDKEIFMGGMRDAYEQRD